MGGEPRLRDPDRRRRGHSACRAAPGDRGSDGGGRLARTRRGSPGSVASWPQRRRRTRSRPRWRSGPSRSSERRARSSASSRTATSSSSMPPESQRAFRCRDAASCWTRRHCSPRRSARGGSCARTTGPHSRPSFPTAPDPSSARAVGDRRSLAPRRHGRRRRRVPLRSSEHARRRARRGRIDCGRARGAGARARAAVRARTRDEPRARAHPSGRAPLLCRDRGGGDRCHLS